jgi:hypothetical protein
MGRTLALIAAMRIRLVQAGADDPVRFEKKVSPRKFKGYLTDVQMTLEEKERVQEAAVA